MSSPIAEVRPAPLVGTVLTLPGAGVAELLSEPWDIVWVDLEHAAFDRAGAQESLIGAQAAGARAFVRVPSAISSLKLAASMIDAGAEGIVAPDVKDPQEADALARALRHPPDGERGYGPRRLGLRGRTLHSVAAHEPELWVQIESRAGVQAAGEIAAVEGVDALILGVADLSYALGAPLKLDAPELGDAGRAVRDAARAQAIGFGLAGPIIDHDGLLAAPALADVIADAAVLVHSTEARLCAAAVDRAAQQLRGLLTRDATEAT